MNTKINKVELTGNLVTDARVKNDLTFITIATWNGKDKEGNNLPPTYHDVALFHRKQELIDQLKKGQRINIEGKLTNYKNKEGHRLTGVYAYKVNIIKKENSEEKPIFDEKEISQKSNDQKEDWFLDVI